MLDLIRRWRGERGESYGISLDGDDLAAVGVRRLAGGRVRIEVSDKPTAPSWLVIRKDITFQVRHVRVAPDFRGSLYNYIQACAPEKFPNKDEAHLIRSDEIQDPDGVVFVHGIQEKKYREVVKDFAVAGIDPRRQAGLTSQAVALDRAVRLLERHEFQRFYMILHKGRTGLDIVCIRDGRTVFHRSLPVQLLLKSSAQEMSTQLPFFQQLMVTLKYLENNPSFGVPEEIILTGTWPPTPEIPDEIAAVFSNTPVHRVSADAVVSESLTAETLQTHILAIGAAAVGLDRTLSDRLNFLAEPRLRRVTIGREQVHDKIILGCGAAMLALAFVTANAFFLDMTKSRLAKIAEHQKTVKSLRAEVRSLAPELESANRLLTAASIRFDAARSRTFSIPVSVSKLLSAVESAAPDGVTLDKLESGIGADAASADGRYSNFFSGGDAATVVLSGKAELPEYVIFFQDALRDKLGVSVEIVSMSREGDVWAKKPVGFVIALRGAIRRV